MDFQSFRFADVLLVAGVCAALALVGAIVLLVIAARQIMHLDIPEDADFFETLQIVPITVPLALDLLDMAFDVFAAPISWIVLELLGLQSLQLVTVFEGLIPGTQVIPTLTIAWVLARIMKARGKGRRSRMQEEIYQYQQLDRASRYQRLAARRGDIVSSYRSRPLLTEEIMDGEFVEEEEEMNFYEDEWEDDY